MVVPENIWGPVNAGKVYYCMRVPKSHTYWARSALSGECLG